MMMLFSAMADRSGWRRRWQEQQGQGAVEYLLVTALIALVLAALLSWWHDPLAAYLNRVAQALSKTR